MTGKCSLPWNASCLPARLSLPLPSPLPGYLSYCRLSTTTSGLPSYSLSYAYSIYTYKATSTPSPLAQRRTCPGPRLLCSAYSDAPSSLLSRSRRDGRSNGTAILRRSSTTPFNNTSNQPVHPVSAAPIGTSLLPVANDTPPASATSQFAPLADSNMGRYSQDQLLDAARNGAAFQPVDVSSLLMEGFSPGGHINGHSSRGWGKPNDANTHNDPTVCWNAEGSSGPLGLQDMSVDEKEVSTLVGYTEPSLHRVASHYIVLRCALRHHTAPPSGSHAYPRRPSVSSIAVLANHSLPLCSSSHPTSTPR